MDLKDFMTNQPDDGNFTAAKSEILAAGDIQNNSSTDSATALQLFLDRIPVKSIPGIEIDSSVLELETGVSVKDAIELLYKKNVAVAPISDVFDPEATVGRSSDRYIGFIDFASLILWSLENCEESGSGGISLLSMLEQNPYIGETKLAELAKSFLWEPYFPVNLDDTLFHVMLLLSAHRLHVVPVMERPDSHIIGFATLNAVIELLLQSHGLEWFDNIATKPLSEFRFENGEHVDIVYGDESVAEALPILSKSQAGAIAVVDKGTPKLIGCFRRNDVHLLMDNNLFENRKNLTMEKFIQTESATRGDMGALSPRNNSSTRMDLPVTNKKSDTMKEVMRNMTTCCYRRNLTMEKFIQTESATRGDMGALSLRHNLSTRMDSPVTNKKSDTMKDVMRNMTRNRSDYSFLIDDSGNAIGVLTMRDVITQFSPPCMNSNIHGVGFFDSALEQVGCKVKSGIVVSEH